MQRLKPLIQEMSSRQPGQMIRIGCEHGSGFIYVGAAGLVDYDCLNRIVRKKLPKNAPNKYKVETRKKWEEAVTDYVPVECRTVIDRFKSEVEDHIIIIVEGFGGFIQHDPADSGNTDYDLQAMIDLVGALYKETCRELINAYARGDRENIERCERWIRRSPYGFVADPEGIIRACRQAKDTRFIKNFYHRTK